MNPHIAHYDTDNQSDSTWIEILNGHKSIKVIGIYYRQPKKKSNNIFSENLQAILHSLRNNKNYLVADDFNYEFLKLEHNPVTNEFLNLI